jgi:hypothetical protein
VKYYIQFYISSLQLRLAVQIDEPAQLELLLSYSKSRPALLLYPLPLTVCGETE